MLIPDAQLLKTSLSSRYQAKYLASGFEDKTSKKIGHKENLGIWEFQPQMLHEVISLIRASPF